MGQHRDHDLDMGGRLFFLFFDAGLLAFIGADFFGADPKHGDYGAKILCFLAVLLLVIGATIGVVRKFKHLARQTRASEERRDSASA